MFGFVSPYIYPLLILLLPFNINSIQKLFLAFGLGLCMDFFQDSGGIHAAATLVITYFRPVFLRYSFGLSYDYQTIKFYNTPFRERLVYISLMILVHHIVLFALEIFSFSLALYFIEKTLYSSIFSIFLILIILNLISRKD
ncbi:MAG: rod shape-determining protein MreD [Psychroflexus sp.]